MGDQGPVTVEVEHGREDNIGNGGCTVVGVSDGNGFTTRVVVGETGDRVLWEDDGKVEALAVGRAMTQPPHPTVAPVMEESKVETPVHRKVAPPPTPDAATVVVEEEANLETPAETTATPPPAAASGTNLVETAVQIPAPPPPPPLVTKAVVAEPKSDMEFERTTTTPVVTITQAAKPCDNVAAAAAVPVHGTVHHRIPVPMSVDDGIIRASAAPGPGEKSYPAPLMTNEEVIRNPGVFIDALRRFHAAMGTKFMIPVIGGRDLDLHLLYVQVTQRGGLEKVVTQRRWREVIAAFNFPPTTTSASFVLRKYYISLLHHFEQVYYFRLQGPLVAPAAILQTRSPSSSKPTPHHHPNLPVHHQYYQDLPVAGTRKSGLTDLESHKAACTNAAPCSTYYLSPAPPPRPPPLSFTVSGTIDGKFEHGYLVSVKMGTDTLRGVLFHARPAPVYHGEPVAPQPPAAPFATSTPMTAGAYPAYSNAIVPFGPLPTGPGRRRRKGWKRLRDPDHPKPNRSAYNFFFADKHSKLKEEFPQRERGEFSKMIGESWGKLTEEERTVYQEIGVKDKERYMRELQEYKEKLKFVQPMAGATLAGVKRPAASQ